MKFFRIFFISIAVLLVSCAGTMAAATQPQYYLNEEGTPVSLSGTTMTQISSSSLPEGGLSFGSGEGNWYWIESGKSSPLTSITFNSQTSGSNNQGTMNIVIVPSSDSSSTGKTTIQSTDTPWTLSSGQELNIYQAATSAPNTIPISQCDVTLENQNSNGTTGQSAIVVNGGTFNVNSGIWNATAAGAAGVNLTNGQINVSPYATLLCMYNGSTETNSKDNPGLAISGGTLTNQGYIRVAQNLLSQPTESGQIYDYAAIDNTTTNDSGLVLDGGTIQTSTPYTPNAALSNGVWVETYGTSGSSSVYTATTFNIDAFGTSTLNMGKYTTLTLGQGNSFEVAQGANLTIPGNTTVTLGEGSTLTNNGTITVDPSETTQQS